MRISANRAFSSGEFGRHSDGPFIVTGILKTQVEKEWPFALSFSPNVLRFPILAQSHKLAVPKVAVRRPFDELELPDELRLEPQCRMPDYAASAVASVIISAFNVILFGIIRLSMRHRNRAPFAHVSKR
jgi:hypothetical protein